MDNQYDVQQPVIPQQSFFSKFKSFFSGNKSLIILIVFLTLISFGTTGYLLMTNKKTPKTINPSQMNVILTSSPTPTPQKTPSSAPSISPTPAIALANLTATWSAYVSSKYSYSIKYPPNWTALATTQQDPKILEYVVFNPVATKAGTLSITLSYGTRTYSEALALDPQIGQTIQVASVSATKKNSKDSNGNQATNIIVPFGSNTIIFNAKNAYTNLFDQMLTTLKLTK